MIIHYIRIVVGSFLYVASLKVLPHSELSRLVADWKLIMDKHFH